MKLKILYLIIVLMFNSCLSNQELLKNKITGKWAIEKIEFNYKDYKSYLYSNILIFYENSDISIPETVHFINDPNSTWKVVDNKLVIESSNLAFKETFTIKFLKRTKDKPQGLEIKSDSIYIKAYNLFDLEK